MNINSAPYKTPIHSDALGMQPCDVAEHREKFPDIEIDSENRPVFTNMKQHDSYMEKIGVVKVTQRVRAGGVVIAALDRWGNEIVVGEENGKEEKGRDDKEEVGVHEDRLD